jgi:hypothetical protein
MKNDSGEAFPAPLAIAHGKILTWAFGCRQGVTRHSTRYCVGVSPTKKATERAKTTAMRSRKGG